jgi:hypothetical protein
VMGLERDFLSRQSTIHENRLALNAGNTAPFLV